MASPRQVVEWLLKTELLDPARLLDQELIVRDISRRNRNTIVEWPDGSGYIIKQARDKDRHISLANESVLTGQIGAEANTSTRASFRVPRLVSYDALTSRVVFDLVPNARSLRDIVGTRLSVPVGLARRIGRMLRDLHRSAPPGDAPLEMGRTSWLRRLAAPSREQYATFSSASRVLVAALQSSPAVCKELEELSISRDCLRFIHGDIRWDNVLIEPTGQLWLVDWELAQRSDPLFDVGGFVADCLWHWLRFVPTARHVEDDQETAGALRGLQRSFRAFWNAYNNHSNKEQDFGRLATLTRFCAVKLVQASFERTQVTDQFDRRLVLLLQLAENMLLKPDKAMQLLCG